MGQVNVPKFPAKLQLDSAHEKMQDIESRYLKNVRVLQNANPNNTNQSGNNTKTGSNAGSQTPLLSNQLVDDEFSLPLGINKTIGSYESRETNELYWFVWNSNLEHTVNLIDGYTEKITTVFKGSCLEFSLDPKYAIPEHKVYLQLTYDSTLVDGEQVKTLLEKELIFTDSLNNIRQINVFASIGSNSFTTDYFKPVFPHYNACCDYITLAPIAPMYCPQVELIPRVQDENGHAIDKDLPNKFFNNPLQVANNFGYIDNRPSTVSPYSTPIIVGGTDCSDQNPETLPRCAKIKLWAGNAFVNSINIYFRTAPNGNWYLYDTIFKHNCPDENVKWWERTEAWADYNYNEEDNTIEYEFCANKECTPIDQSLFEHIENNIPFASVALSPAGNNLLLANTLVGSDNLTCEQVSSFSISVTPQESDVCEIPKRQIKIYMIIRNDSEDSSGNGNECEFLFGNSTPLDSPIDGNFYFGGFGWRKHPVTGNKKVAIDGRSGWDSWKGYKQYVPATIEEQTGGFVGYLAGTNFVSISSQVKYFDGNCDVEELGIIYRSLATMYDINGSFDSIVEALKDGEYLILQEFVFEDVPAGKYVFRVAGHRSGMDNGFEQTSSYVYGSEAITPCAVESGECVTPAIRNDYEWTIDVCECDYNSLNDGYLMKLLDLTYPDFENDLRNVITYNFVREVYVYEDENNSIPFEKQQANFEFGKFKDKITGLDVTVDGFEVGGVPLYLIDPWSVNGGGIGVPLPCPTPFPIIFWGLLKTPSGVVNTTLRETDHNGFVFHREQFWRWRLFYNILICSPMDIPTQFGEPTLGTFSITYTDKCYNLNFKDVQVGITKVQPPVTLLHNKGYKGLLGTVSVSTGTADDECNRYLIKGNLKDTEGNALVGANIGYTGSQFVMTDGFGNFSLIAHQNTSFDRSDYFIISNVGSACTIVCVDSEDCTLCCEDTYQEITLDDTPCVLCEKLEIDMGDFVFKKINFPDRGLKGRYGIGVVGWDCYGRIVTGGVNVIDYINVPECWTKHPLISWSWDGLNLLPQEVKYISFYMTKNLNGNYIQWVADAFDLLDENGNVTTNRGKAVAVAVDMKSLLQYNIINKFNTLATYQFAEGDILKIIDDCENPIIYRITGTTFGTPDTTALEQELTVTNNVGDTATTKTNYATSNGSTIIIPFDGQIDALLDRCAVKIEIVRPYQCEDNQYPFFELCCMIPVYNGVPMADFCCGGSGESGSSGSGESIGCVLDAFDTYKIFRNIPLISGCTANPDDDPYFSNNVTDFWGAGVGSFGRIGVKNPYAQRIWEQNRVSRSLAWINNGIINGLSTFWSENVKDYDTQNFGGIQAMYAFRNFVGFICTQDFFSADYKVPYLYNDGNQIRVTSLDQNLGEPKQKSGMNYGCFQENTSSIVFNDGLSYYYSQNEYVMCDFNIATDIGKEGVKSWMIDKNKYLQNFNKAIANEGTYEYFLFEVISGYDPMNDEVITTIRPRNGLSQNTKSFVNENRDIRIEVGETIVYNTTLKVWTNFRGYVPEYYGKLKNANSGMQMYTFVNGVPYQHNNLKDTYCTFYGHKQTPVIEVLVNNTDSKVKIFQSASQEILPQTMFVDRIMTEEINSLSYLPMPYWNKKENIFYGAFWRDMASYWDANYMQESTYFEGKRIFGKFAFMRYVNTYDNSDKYFALTHFWTLLTGSELSMKPQITAPNQGGQ